MAEHTCGWDLLRQAELQASRTAFEARTDFASLIAEATRRGYRRITMSEQIDPGHADAYTWRGGVWVKA